jgi:hypothetical protein
MTLSQLYADAFSHILRTKHNAGAKSTPNTPQKTLQEIT